MKIFVTGGAGYVGSACLRWLLHEDHDAVAFDNLVAGNANAVPEGRLIEGDIEDSGALARAMKEHGSEAVMHFAAVASVPESIDQPELYYRTNVFGSKNVLDAANLCGIKRILFSSTAAVYGFHSEMPLREDSPRDPVTPYGKTKLAAEWMLEDYRRAYGMGFTALRYFNACGADSDGEFGEDRQHETHVIPLIFQTALGKRPTFQVFGGDWETPDGTCVRDYVHTEDLASAHQLAVEALKPGEARVYNVGIGKGFSVREVLEACTAVIGKPVPTKVADRRPGDPETLIASCDKLKSELGWSPRHTEIREIVQTAWDWHARYPDGYRDKASSAGR